MNKLKLLALGKDFIVEEKENGGYNIRDKHSDLEASVDILNTIGYYIGGAYNSGNEYLEIDIDRLMKLKEFAEMMCD